MKRKNKLKYGGIIIFYIVLFLLYGISMIDMTGGLCPFQGVLGIPCPACGSTRAIILLTKGDLVGSLNMNPMALLFLLCLMNEIRVCYFKRGDPKKAMILLLVTVGISVLVYFVRMKLYFPYREPYLIEKRSLLFRLLQIFRHFD
ncbi:DUF2752 domain-containing protein [Clostridium sp. E02]|uniref:DUF2752 domain-containing protein n=1 Tax=Clostridium sp. E02 TaxID=2487134 RepID=UPI000F5261EA|nr:DUF2752 domain-containing protein [Clostridium sp. E02]